MKREIVKAEYLSTYREFQKAVVSHGEQLVIVRGKANGNYQCDYCGDAIKPGDDIIAASFVAEGQRYRPWEDRYLSTTEEIDA